MSRAFLDIFQIQNETCSCSKFSFSISGQKGLDLDMAMAYWNIVLKGRFRFLDVWNRFLKVNFNDRQF